jgi:carbonic anhydrase
MQFTHLYVDDFRNGEQYAGEIHFVHRNPRTKKIAVLAIFMKGILNPSSDATKLYHTEPSTIMEWTRYIADAEQLRRMNDSAPFSLNISALMGNQLNTFWRYEGSLTVPPCTEGVTWTVFTTPIVFDETNINRIRENLLPVNNRNPKPVFNRKVYRNFPNASISSVPDYQCSSNHGKNVIHGFYMLLLLCLGSLSARIQFLLYA